MGGPLFWQHWLHVRTKTNVGLSCNAVGPHFITHVIFDTEVTRVFRNGDSESSSGGSETKFAFAVTGETNR